MGNSMDHWMQWTCSFRKCTGVPAVEAACFGLPCWKRAEGGGERGEVENGVLHNTQHF